MSGPETLAGRALAGRTIVVTGGNSGIGEAIVLAAAAQGANIVIDYVTNPDATASLADRVETLGGVALGVKADVAKPSDVQMLVREAVTSFGRLDAMINNAGIENRTALLDTVETDYDTVMNVNLKGAFFGCQAAAKQFIAQGDGGLIVNISSVHEDWPMPGNIAYCVTKGGMRMLTRTAGVELAGHGIRVVGVAPGAVDTPINASTESNPDLLAKLDSAIPLGRMATPDEIANLVVYLASGGGSYMTATTITVDGGLTQGSVGL